MNGPTDPTAARKTPPASLSIVVPDAPLTVRPVTASQLAVTEMLVTVRALTGVPKQHMMQNNWKASQPLARVARDRASLAQPKAAKLKPTILISPRYGLETMIVPLAVSRGSLPHRSSRWNSYFQDRVVPLAASWNCSSSPGILALPL